MTKVVLVKEIFKMNILGAIEKNANANGGRLAFSSRAGEITYQSLWEGSDRLAAWIDGKLKDNKKPVVVYGHKSPLMLVCFLACAKSGRAYCPVDTCMPPERIGEIVEAVDNTLVLATEPLDVRGRFIADSTLIERCMSYEERITKDKWLSPEHVFYIIFTSGSTGKPKGVMITENNLDNYCEWSRNLGGDAEDKDGSVFLNQAPFSFDLSVMDVYTSLTNGGTIYSVDKALQQDIKKMLAYMEAGKLKYWVSTPSFADMCLADPSFNSKLLPGLKAFLFCGEKLTKRTARKLMERFPEAKVVNTYGPTESTVAVTSVTVTDELMKDDGSLPIGIAKPGTEIRIVRADGTVAAAKESGEILILGDTVSPGYFNNKKKTDLAFSTLIEDGKEVRCYRTGDAGYLDENGMLYYVGRIDMQVKVHGYRIELGDIETNLTKYDGVSAAAVVPKWQDDKIRYLAAFVVSDKAEGTFEERKSIKTFLKGMLPEYMVPKKVAFVDSLPMTSNGKTDRKKLEEYL